MKIAGVFAWYRGQRGFYAEKQASGYILPKDAPEPVDKYPLNEAEMSLSILILEQRFPCRAKIEDEPKVKLEATS